MKVVICVGTFFSIDKINLCFFFAGSVIFLFANNVCEAFILIALSRDTITCRMIEISREKRNKTLNGWDKKVIYSLFLITFN